MLSAESAAGKYPVEAGRVEGSIAAEDAAPPHHNPTDAAHPEPEATISDVICTSLRQAAPILPVKAIVTYTTSGSTTLRAARAARSPDLEPNPGHQDCPALDAGLGHLPDPDSAAEMLSEIVEYACHTAAPETRYARRYHCHRRRHAVRRGRHHHQSAQDRATARAACVGHSPGAGSKGPTEGHNGHRQHLKAAGRGPELNRDNPPSSCRGDVHGREGQHQRRLRLDLLPDLSRRWGELEACRR